MTKALKILDDNCRVTVFQILIVGAGGNGSYFIRNLTQMVRMYLNQSEINNRLHVDITIADEDRVEEKNLNNQLFISEDIGDYKVTALAERYGETYDLEIKQVTEYVKNFDMIKRLLPKLSVNSGVQVIPIIFSMVDNNKTRQLFDEYFYSDEVTDLIYIDAGVEGVFVPETPDHLLSDEDKEMINRSGFGGQVVCGLKMGGEVFLEPVGRIYRNILDDASSSFPDESCGDTIINNPQRCMTNQTAAQIASVYMNNLLHTGSIFAHYINFNSQYGGQRPVFISDDIINRFNQKERPFAL